MHERECVYSTANNAVLSSLVRVSIVVGEQVRNPVEAVPWPMESTVTTPAAEDIALVRKYLFSCFLAFLFSVSYLGSSGSCEN
jgi:hypothetical protein